MGRSLNCATRIIRFCEQFRGLLKADGGSLTPAFALTLVPLVGFVGAAVDYSRANAARTAMQAAVDSTALMLSKYAPTLNESQLHTKASEYFNAMFIRPDVTGVSVVTNYTSIGGSQLYFKASASVKAEFMHIMGFNNFNISASSTVKWGNRRLRVALVLDNTGSMSSSGKMTALKTATKNLLTQLQSAATNNGDVYVSIVPFSKDVNVGASNYNATWVDFTKWNTRNGTCSKNWYTKQSSCEDNGGTWTAANPNTWNGCVEDRGNSNGPHTSNYDTNVLPVDVAVNASKFPAEQHADCPAPVMELSYNWSAMNTAVDSMSPDGNTNQGLGLVLGWQSLVGGGPFPTPPALDPNYEYQQVIILLTDGMNTENRWYNDDDPIDDRQELTCANVKAAGITLYTVQVNTGSDPTSTMLQNCASSADKFFLLTTADQMIATFNTIGTALSQLRLAL